MSSVHGLHHVTCIARDPQRNLDFYRGLLGMRLVKRTVNQDAPDTYHLFYADAVGSPGSDLTFFPWPDMPAGREGSGLASEVYLAIPLGSAGYWEDRLSEAGVTLDRREDRFGESVALFRDPDGLSLGLVEVTGRTSIPWAGSPVPAESQVIGLHGVRLKIADGSKTRELLTAVMGFRIVRQAGDTVRLEVDGGGSGSWVDVEEDPRAERGKWGPGSVHHVAWTVRDSDEELALREALSLAGHRPTPQIDRFWFRSVYFREPGGVLFELATEGPGFTVDEDEARLGEQLVLPPWLEPQRREIESELPTLQ